MVEKGSPRQQKVDQFILLGIGEGSQPIERFLILMILHSALFHILHFPYDVEAEHSLKDVFCKRTFVIGVK